MCHSHISVLRKRTWELMLIDLTWWMISNINCLVFLLEGCSLAGRMERNWQIGPAPLISRMTEQWRVAVTQAPGTNTRGDDYRDIAPFVWTTNVSTACMKNEICSFLWLLSTAPHGTEDARGAQVLCCFPPSRPWGHFGICHKHPCSTQEGDFCPGLSCFHSPTNAMCQHVAVWESGTWVGNVPTREYWCMQSMLENLAQGFLYNRICILRKHSLTWNLSRG